MTQASADLEVVAKRLAQVYPEHNRDITREFARRFWGGQDPLASVCGSITARDRARGSPSLVSPGSRLLAVRSPGDAARFGGAIRGVVQAVDLDLALFDVRTFYAAVQDSRLFFRTREIGIVPTDPISFATASIVLVAAGVLACWLPAWRAARAPPIRAFGTDEH